MKSKLLFALFTVVISLLSLFAGFVAGTSNIAGSNVSQLYYGALELQAIQHYIDTQRYEEAKKLICNSLKARVNIMNLAKPMMSSRKSDEIDQFSQSLLVSEIENNEAALLDNCN